jgi:hypothetical protein
MSTPQELLLGIPINPFDNAVSFENIWQNASGQQTIPSVGSNGLPSGVTNPSESINYLMNKRTMMERAAYQRPLVRLADKNLNIIAELTGEMSMEFEELMTDSGSAKYVVDWSNWMVDYIVNLTSVEEDLHLIIDPLPGYGLTWQNRWGGKIHTVNVKREADGTNCVELIAVSNREHAKRLLFGANPFFAPEVQLPRMWLLPGPTRSVLFLSAFVNLARLFVPGLSFITNVFNPLGWLNPLSADSLFDVDPLAWPIQVAFVNPVADQSSWTVLGATWTSWHDASADILVDSGVMMRVYTYLREDDASNPEQPYEELIDLVDVAIDLVSEIIDDLIGVDPDLANQLMTDVSSVMQPSRNCVIFSFEDKSGQTGPTGSALDGLLDVIGVTLDDLVSSVLINAQTGLTLDGEPVYDLEGSNFPIFESLLGVAPAVPNVIWREGTFSASGTYTGFSSETEATHTLNKGSPATVMTGGKSPSIVNDSITFAIKWGLAQLSDLINPAFGSFSWGAANTAWVTPLMNGIENIYNGELSDVFFAWERITNPVTLIWGGDLDFQEYFERGSSVAWTLASVITLQTALWKTRAYQGFQGQILNGFEWTVDVDTVLGDRNGWEFSGVIYVDQIYGIKRMVADKKSPLTTTLTIGNNKDKGDPLARLIRVVQGVYSLFGAFLGEGTIFN